MAEGLFGSDEGGIDQVESSTNITESDAKNVRVRYFKSSNMIWLIYEPSLSLDKLQINHLI